MHLYDTAVIGIWLVVVYAIWAATEAGDPGVGQLFFFIVGFVLTFVLRKLKFEHTIGLEKKEQQLLDSMKEQAEVREMARDYDSAIELWERLGEIGEAARVRKLKGEQNAVKVDQTVVQGDQITKTEIKDSVLNRSNIGDNDDKVTKIEKISEMKEKGLIDDEEFKQMKKEILGK